MEMSTENRLPATVSGRLTPGHERQQRLSLVNDLKLLFSALGAGGSVIPMGDNGRTARRLSEYAASLRNR
jgi:hypothetical protein